MKITQRLALLVFACAVGVMPFASAHADAHTDQGEKETSPSGAYFQLAYSAAVADDDALFEWATGFGLAVGLESVSIPRLPDLRIEAEFNINYADNGSLTDPDNYDLALSVLLNAYYDFHLAGGRGTLGRFQPYIGAGIGSYFLFEEDRVEEDLPPPYDRVATNIYKAQDAIIVYAVHAGVNYRINDRLGIVAGYRYLFSHDEINLSRSPPPDSPLADDPLGFLRRNIDVEQHGFRVGVRFTY